MRVAFDSRTASDPRGVGRYSRCLLQSLRDTADAHKEIIETHRPSASGAGPVAARSRGTARNARPLEGSFDHGEEGYGLWLDPAIQDNPIYAEHWAGHRPVEVTIEEDRIVIRRTSTGSDDE